MWFFVLGYWFGAAVLHYIYGRPDYGGAFGVTFMALLIEVGFITV